MKDGKESKGRLPADARPSSEAVTRVTTSERSNAATLMQRLLPLLLVGIGLAAYYNSFAGAFLLDDNPWIVNNPQIRQNFAHWKAMVQTSRPVVQLSLALNYTVAGATPWGYHAVNLAIHIAAGLLLYGIVRRMLESDPMRARYGRVSRWLALAVSGIWLAHPLQTESVTYIIQRTESLMGLFFLLTLFCGIRACESQRRGWAVAAVLACALGMGSKEVMVSAPILMWLYDWMFVSRTFTETFRRRFGFYAALAATWLVLLTSLAASRSVEQAFSVPGLNPLTYALTQFEVIVHYLRLAAWPNPLVFDYAWPIADPLSSVLPSAVVVLALVAGTLIALRRRLWIGFWGAWFFLILAPTSSILPIPDVAFEHRMYLPLAAVVAIVVVGGHDVLAHLGRHLGVSAESRGWLEGGLVVVAVVILGYASVRRNEAYRSELAMWSDTVSKRPKNARAHSNLGVVLTKEGKSDEALAHFTKAVELKPDYAVAQNNLGSALLKLGRNEEAAAHFSRAASAKPGSSQGHYALGRSLYARGRIAEAVAEYSTAVRLEPRFAEGHHALGLALLESGDVSGATNRFAEAMRLDPSFADARISLGLGLVKQGRAKEAIGHYSEALRLKPDEPVAHNGLASALAQEGKVTEAITHYNEALRLKPDYAEAQNNLGAALHRLGQVDEAIARFTEAIRLNPNYAEAHNNLGAALGGQGKLDQAIGHFASAVRLKPDFTEARDNLRKAEATQRRVPEPAAAPKR